MQWYKKFEFVGSVQFILLHVLFYIFLMIFLASNPQTLHPILPFLLNFILFRTSFSFTPPSSSSSFPFPSSFHLFSTSFTLLLSSLLLRKMFTLKQNELKVVFIYREPGTFSSFSFWQPYLKILFVCLFSCDFFTFFIIDFDGYYIVLTDQAHPRPKYIFNKMWN